MAPAGNPGSATVLPQTSLLSGGTPGDHIVRRGVTFRASETGIEGLVKNKKVYLAFSSAGFYTEDSPDQSYDFVVPLLKAVLGWLGITDITVVRANGLRNPELQATSLQKGIESIHIA